MLRLLLLLAFMPLYAHSAGTCTTCTYFLSATATSFTIGNSTYPLNSVILNRSTDTNAVGFSYANIPPQNNGQWSNVILSPKRYNKFYIIDKGDTTVFTSATAVINWYNKNAVDTFVNTSPTYIEFTASPSGTTSVFSFTIPAGKTFGNFQSQNLKTPPVKRTIISGTTLTIYLDSIPFAGVSTVQLGGFYK